MKRRKVLLLTHRVPFPPDRGDRIRAWQMLRQLAVDNDVYLGATADEPVTTATRQTLSEYCAEYHIAPLGRTTRWSRGAWAMCNGLPVSQGMFAQPRLQEVINRWQRAHTFDAAVVYCSTMFPYLEGAAWRAVPKLVDLIDVDSRKWQDYAHVAQGWRKQIYQREAEAIAELERRIVERADAVAVTTAVEAELLRQVTLEARPLVIANGVDLPAAPVPLARSTPGRLVFVGVLDYLPNVQGIAWFVDQIWPQIRLNHANATLEIVGRNPTSAIRDLGSLPGIRIHPNVPDVRTHIQGAEIVIAPLRIARGVQNKVLEGMAENRATVVSPAACQGINVTPGKHVLVADSPADWRQAINDLLTSPLRREELARAGYEFVCEQHHWSACLAPLTDWIEQVSPPTVATRMVRSA